MTKPARPLHERFDPEGAANEFTRLMHQLLLSLAQKHGFHYEDVGAWRLNAGSGFLPVHGHASGGDVPGMEGPVAFEFLWPWPEDNVHLSQGDIGRAYSAYPQMKSIKSWVVVTPECALPGTRGTVTEARVAAGVAVHFWGPAQIHDLLLLCPPLLARYFPEEAAPLLPGYDGYDFRDFTASYRERVAVVHQGVRFLGLPPEVMRERDARTDIRLCDIFIPLEFVPHEGGGEARGLKNLLSFCRSAVILGDPGTGKSTLMAFLALLWAGAANLDGFNAPSCTVPLLIPLRDFARLHKANPSLTLLDYLELRARTDLSLSRAHRAFFEAALLMGEAVVLVDGLDEVGGEAARATIAKKVREFRAQFPGCPFWVTSRIYGYTSDLGFSAKEFEHFRIGRLDSAAIDDFIARWYVIQLPDHERERTERTNSLQEAVDRTASVRRLAGNPLLLTLMAFIHQGLRRLPKDRGELYDLCVQMLLKNWQEAKAADHSNATVHPFEALQLHVQTQKDYLAHLALYIQARNPGGVEEETRGLISRREALDCLATRHHERSVRDRPALTLAAARSEMEQFLDYISDRTGLLLDRGGNQLSFIHLSFQEYLAAWVFTCGSGGADASFFEKYLGVPAWEEVLLLRMYLVLRMTGGGGETAFDRIVGSLLKRLEADEAATGWLTLARALRDNLDFRAEDRDRVLRRALDYWLGKPSFGGEWFSVLEEIRLFADRAGERLRELLNEAVGGEKQERAVACLHLATRLFGFPSDATARLAARPDPELQAMLPDLVPFLEQGGVSGLLARRASLPDWVRMLAAGDGPELYRWTLGWATGVAPSPVSSVAPVHAAVIVLVQKILEDLGSRAVFGAQAKGRGAESLLRGGRSWFGVKTSLFRVGLPLGAFRVPSEVFLQATAGAQMFRPAEGGALLCPALSGGMWTGIAPGLGTARDALTRAMESDVLRLLAPFTKAKQPTRSPEIAILLSTWVGNLCRDIDPRFRRVAYQHFTREFDTDYNFDFDVDFTSDFSHYIFPDFVRDFGRIFGRDFVDAFGLEYGEKFVRGFRLDLLRGPEERLRNDGLVWEMACHAPRKWESFDKPPLTTETTPGGILLRLDNPLTLPLLGAAMLELLDGAHQIVFRRSMAAQFPALDQPNHVVARWKRRYPFDAFVVALAWEEHAATAVHHGRTLSGPEGLLLLAHGAYAALMTGLACSGPSWQKLLDGRRRDDPLIQFGYAIHEVCHFRDTVADMAILKEILGAPPLLLRGFLEAGGWLPAAPLVVESLAGKSVASPAQDAAVAGPPASPSPAHSKPLFAWIHLSDIHMGHGGHGYRWDQKLVLDALKRDVAARKGEGLPDPDVLLVTGDVAFSGDAAQYAEAKTWLSQVAQAAGLDLKRVFAVPGNHDVERAADKDRNTHRLVTSLRGGTDDLDTTLADSGDRRMLAVRQRNYLNFAEELAPACLEPQAGPEVRLWWSHSREGRGGLRLRFVGLNTSLLSAADPDRGKLRLGKEALAKAFADAPGLDGELVVVLSHHPFRFGWLADQVEADRWVRSRAHVHLAGHVHEQDSEESRSGSASGFVRIVAGAVHGESLPAGAAPSHGYNYAAILRAPDGGLRLRVWPRRWSDKNKEFRADVDNVPRGAAYAEHMLHNLRLPAPR